MGTRLRSSLRDPDHGNNNEAAINKKSNSPSSAPMKAKMVYVTFIALVVDLLAFTLILPLLPSLLDFYRKRENGVGLYSSLESRIKGFGSLLGAPPQFIPVLFGGLIGSLFSFLQFIASPTFGGLSDFFGRRPLLLLSTAGITLSYLAWGAASTFGIFIVARVIGGLSKGNISLATAIVTDVSTPKTRQHGMALIGIAFSLGFLVGPMVGAAFSVWAKQREEDDDWYLYPAAVAFLLSVVDFFFLYFFFEETLPPEKRLKDLRSAFSQALSYINPISLFTFSTIKNLPKKDLKALTTLGRCYFIYLFLYSGLEFTLTFLTHLRFNFTSMEQGKMFLFIGTLMALVQGGYVRKIPQGKEKAMAMFGLLLIVPSFTIIGFSQSKLTLYLGLALYALSTSVVVPCMSTLVSGYGDANQKGIIMGVYRSLGALGRALGPILASVVYWLTGPEICYSIGGLGLVVPYLMLKWI